MTHEGLGGTAEATDWDVGVFRVAVKAETSTPSAIAATKSDIESDPPAGDVGSLVPR